MHLRSHKDGWLECLAYNTVKISTLF